MDSISRVLSLSFVFCVDQLGWSKRNKCQDILFHWDSIRKQLYISLESCIALIYYVQELGGFKL